LPSTIAINHYHQPLPSTITINHYHQQSIKNHPSNKHPSTIDRSIDRLIDYVIRCPSLPSDHLSTIIYQQSAISNQQSSISNHPSTIIYQ
jgi:hypothetical protein